MLNFPRLVLLAPVDNREASNASPKEKKLHYNQSDLVLTKTLSDLALSNSAESAYSKLLRELDLSKPFHVPLTRRKTRMASQ